MRATAKMIVKGGVCTTGCHCDEQELCVGVCTLCIIRAKGNMGGGMIVVVKCRGEEAGNMQLRRTCRSTRNNCGALVNAIQCMMTRITAADP
jgi:hypothetical protein